MSFGLWAGAVALELRHQEELARLRLDRLGAAAHGRTRVLAIACWDFPIYSQTFVYQELTQLLRAGFELRLLYARQQSPDHLSSQFRPLWRSRRQVTYRSRFTERDQAYFRRRTPEKVDRLMAILAEQAGVSIEEIRMHHQVRDAFTFARMVEAYQPHYLHSYFFYEGTLFAFVASYLLDVPRGVSCYSDHMLQDAELKLVPFHLMQCNLVVATSERIKSELLGLAASMDAGKILVKPNAINTASFPTRERHQPAVGEPFRVACVGRIEPKKGQLYLVEALHRLRMRDVPVEGHLIGGVDDNQNSREYASAVERRIAELELRDVVHLEGRRGEADINRIFAASHLFVAPFVETALGDKDGIPTAVLEAMAAGLPVVATDAGSICEVVASGREGVIVPQRDPDALADAIQDLLVRPEYRAELGGQGARKVRKNLDVGVCEQPFHSRIRDVIREHRKATSSTRHERETLDPAELERPRRAQERFQSKNALEAAENSMKAVHPNLSGSKVERVAASSGGDREDLASLDWGALRRVTPISRNWGFDRGLAVDRYYIERFLAAHARDIRGRVLEIEDDLYTSRLRGDRVDVVDVLHVIGGNPKATIVGDLTCAPHIPSNAFDCVVLTQTLQLIYDTRAALTTLHRILKPGGVLLASFPGITRISREEWEGSWFWSFTTASARRLFGETFPGSLATLEAHGNVLVANAFLLGLAAEDLLPKELDYKDPDYEVLITARVQKPGGP